MSWLNSTAAAAITAMAATRRSLVAGSKVARAKNTIAPHSIEPPYLAISGGKPTSGLRQINPQATMPSVTSA